MFKPHNKGRSVQTGAYKDKSFFGIFFCRCDKITDIGQIHSQKLFSRFYRALCPYDMPVTGTDKLLHEKYQFSHRFNGSIKDTKLLKARFISFQRTGCAAIMSALLRFKEAVIECITFIFVVGRKDICSGI